MTFKMCRECAECCRHFAFAKLSQLEIEKIEDFTGLHFSMFTYPIGTEEKGRFLRFKENGDCIFLNKDEGTYSCLVYEARSKVCRDYPSTQKQNEACHTNRTAYDPRDSDEELRLTI